MGFPIRTQGRTPDAKVPAKAGTRPSVSGDYDVVIVRAGGGSFWVKRPKEGGAYMLGDVRESPVPHGLDVYRAMSVALPFVPDGGVLNFPECVWSEGFVVREVAELADPEGALVKAKFEYANPKPTYDRADPSKNLLKLQGWIALDPARNWALRRYEFTREIANPPGGKNAAWPPSWEVRVVGSVRYKKVGSNVIPLESESAITQKMADGAFPTPWSRGNRQWDD